MLSNFKYHMPIGAQFQLKHDNSIYKLIGYNSDKSKVMYIALDDTIIYDSMKIDDTENVANLYLIHHCDKVINTLPHNTSSSLFTNLYNVVNQIKNLYL